MAKKDKGEGELESLRGIVRNQKALIKNLRKELARVHKRKHQYENYLDDVEEQHLEEECKDAELVRKKCPTCSKGDIVLVDLGIRKIYNCNNCEFREVKKA